MKTNSYSWIFKWHFIGGILTLPIILILSVTGIIYLFKDNYEDEKFQSIKEVLINKENISLEEQWDVAQNNWNRELDGVTLSNSPNQSTQFNSGRFSHKSSIFINPYTAKVSGTIETKKTDMHTVRKLHGELLLGSFGTKIVELVASWMVILIISGIYIFWPRSRGIKGLFFIRTKISKQILFRDIHSVLGFWFSLLLLLIIAGGLPWTDIFGSNFKTVQAATNSGFPNSWNSSAYQSLYTNQAPYTLDQMAITAKNQDLVGKVNISFPKDTKGVFSVFNETNELHQMKMLHFDQYSGKLLKSNSWEDIGLMMQTRIWIMAFHQGEFGTWNFILVLITAIGLLFLSIAAIISYSYRKQKGSWSIPDVPDFFKPNKMLTMTIIFLGLLLPMFGFSIIIILLFSILKRQLNRSRLTIKS